MNAGSSPAPEISIASLRKLVRRAGTQVEVAAELGVDPSTLRRWLMPPDRRTALPAPRWLPHALRGLAARRKLPLDT